METDLLKAVQPTLSREQLYTLARYHLSYEQKQELARLADIRADQIEQGSRDGIQYSGYYYELEARPK